MQRLEDGEHRGDVGAEQHAAGDVERYRRDDRHRAVRLGHRGARAEDRCFGLEDVLLRLDDQRVGAPLDERLRLLAEDRHQVAEPEPAHRGIARGGKEPAGADAAGDETRPSVGGVLVRDPPGQRSRPDVEVSGDAALPPFLEARPRRLEGAGLDDIAARVEKSSMHPLDDLRRVQHEAVHPSFERGAAEVVDGRVLGLQARAHRAVEHEHAFVERVDERRSTSARHAHDVTRERLRDTLAHRPFRFEETLFGTTPTPARQYPPARSRPSTGRH